MQNLYDDLSKSLLIIPSLNKFRYETCPKDTGPLLGKLR